MSSELLDRLRAQRAEIAARKEATEQQVRDLGTHLRRLDQALEAYEASLALTSTALMGQPVEAVTRRRTKNALSPTEVGENARRLLLQAGRPLKRGPLLRLFDAEGVPLAGGDRAKVLGTILWRLHDQRERPLFVNTEQGYWPADVELPEGFKRS